MRLSLGLMDCRAGGGGDLRWSWPVLAMSHETRYEDGPLFLDPAMGLLHHLNRATGYGELEMETTLV